MPTTDELVAQVQALFASLTFRGGAEGDLESLLAPILGSLKVRVERQHRLGPRDRPDFLLDPEGGAVALELKVDGSASSILRQAHRYAKYDTVRAVVVVTTKMRHWLPPELGGKPALCLFIGSL